jgi:hypothetical protein
MSLAVSLFLHALSRWMALLAFVALVTAPAVARAEDEEARIAEEKAPLWTPSSGQAFLPRAGQVRLRTGFEYNIPTREYFDKAGARVLDPNLASWTTWQLYLAADYGILDWLAVRGILPMQQISAAGVAPPDTLTYAPYFGAGLRARMTKDAGHWALELSGEVPFGYETDPNPVRWGDGRFAGGPQLDWGFYRPDWFIEVAVGGRFIAEAPAHRLTYSARGGYSPVKGLWLMPRIEGYESPVTGYATTENPLLGVVKSSAKLSVGGQVLYRVDLKIIGFDVTAGYRHAVYGRNLPEERTVELSIGFDL